MSRVSKFVLITPRATSPAGTPPRIHPPLGAIATLSEVMHHDVEAVLLDAAAEGLMMGKEDPSYNPVETVAFGETSYWKTGLNNAEVVRRLQQLKPNVIGISCCTVVDRGELCGLSDAIKKAFPTTPIVLGGHEATHWYREILGETSYPMESAPSVDYVVIGPGQPVITGLLGFLSGTTDCVPGGVAFRNGLSVSHTDPVPFEPDSFSSLDYSLFPQVTIPGREKPLDVYSSVGNPHAGRISALLGAQEGVVSYLPVLTSYGCGFDCAFCDTDKRLLRYGVEKVVAMVEQFSSIFGIDYIDFMDNNFSGGSDRSRSIAFAILDELANLGYPALGFSNGLTFESMMRDNFRMLRKFADHGNVRHIAFPCENGNDRVLRMVRKPHNTKMIRTTLSFASEELRSTNREGFFIGGFPSTDGKPAESPEELENTLDLIGECLDRQWLNQAIFLTLSPVTREYRRIWRNLYPEAPFEHCLFSRRTGVWPFPSSLLDEMRRKVDRANSSLGRTVTRRL